MHSKSARLALDPTRQSVADRGSPTPVPQIWAASALRWVSGLVVVVLLLVQVAVAQNGPITGVPSSQNSGGQTSSPGSEKKPEVEKSADCSGEKECCPGFSLGTDAGSVSGSGGSTGTSVSPGGTQSIALMDPAAREKDPCYTSRTRVTNASDHRNRPITHPGHLAPISGAACVLWFGGCATDPFCKELDVQVPSVHHPGAYDTVRQCVCDVAQVGSPDPKDAAEFTDPSVLNSQAAGYPIVYQSRQSGAQLWRRNPF